MSAANKKEKIIILGGGVAGLSAAWKLAEQGKRVQVIDQDSQVGGLSRTIRRGDFSFDLGGHRFFTLDRELESEIVALMDGSLGSCSRVSTILLGGKFYKYPLDLADLILKAGPGFMFSAFTTYLLSNIKRVVRPGPEVTFEDWVKSRFGKTLYDIYFAVYTRKLWGIEPSHISADWAAQRITLINLLDVFYRLVRRKTNIPRTYVVEFLFPPGGIGEIPERMAERILSAGGRITLDSRAVRVERTGPNAIAVQYEKGGSLYTIKGTHLVVTIPLPDFVHMIQPQIPSALMTRTGGLRFRALRFLNVCIDREQISKNTWIYIPEKEYLFFRIQEPRNWSPALAPPGKTSLILEIACDEGDELWNATDRELLDRALPDLARLGFGVEEHEVIDYFSIKEKHSYPIYHLGYKEDVEAIRSHFDDMEDVVLCGRQGIYRYNNMDHSIQMGFYAAKYLLGELQKHEIYGIAEGETSFESRA